VEASTTDGEEAASKEPPQMRRQLPTPHALREAGENGCRDLPLWFVNETIAAGDARASPAADHIVALTQSR
jgi:hypothetical protein